MNYVFLEKHGLICYSLCASTKHDNAAQALSEAKSLGRGGLIIQFEGNFKYFEDKVVGIETNNGYELFKNEEGFFDWQDVEAIMNQCQFFEVTLKVGYLMINKISTNLYDFLRIIAPAAFTDHEFGEDIYNIASIIEKFNDMEPASTVWPVVEEEITAIKKKMDLEGCDFLRIVKS